MLVPVAYGLATVLKAAAFGIHFATAVVVLINAALLFAM
jgi:hypothetical protein